MNDARLWRLRLICSGHAAKASKRLFYVPGWLFHEVVPGDRISNNVSIDHLSTLFPYPVNQEWLELWFVSPNEHASVSRCRGTEKRRLHR